MTTAPLDTHNSDTLTDHDTLFDQITGHQRQEDDGADKDRFSHYVKKDDIVRAEVYGEKVYALCGKRWKPQRNPEQYPVCKTCQEILDAAFPEG